MDLNLGDTRRIISACLEQGLLRNQAAYVLATAYHETVHATKPVREYGGKSTSRPSRAIPMSARTTFGSPGGTTTKRPERSLG